MDPVFTWIETSALSTWLRENPSIMVFPFVLILHTVGLAFLVGANVAINARVLGLARGVPLLSLRRYYLTMWVGFWINAFSGVLLLIAYPTKALTNPLFYAKLALIGIALYLARLIRGRVMEGTVAAGTPAPQPLRMLAAASLAVWGLSIFAGRFLAYTCSRLMVETSC
jgi:hypothetical protein